MGEYIRLTEADSGRHLHFPVGHFAFAAAPDGSECVVQFGGREVCVVETEAEILALLGLRNDPK